MSLHKIGQGRKWLPKTWWTVIIAARHRCLSAPSILPKPGWAIAYPAHPPVMPLGRETKTSKCKFSLQMHKL
jgi:hypothetical protein